MKVVPDAPRPHKCTCYIDKHGDKVYTCFDPEHKCCGSPRKSERVLKMETANYTGWKD